MSRARAAAVLAAWSGDAVGCIEWLDSALDSARDETDRMRHVGIGWAEERDEWVRRLSRTERERDEWRQRAETAESRLWAAEKQPS